MAAPLLAAQERTVFDFGHLDIDWTYIDDEWSVKLVWDEEFPAAEVAPADGVLVAKDEPYAEGEGSRATRSSGSQWDFLGVDEGADIWVLPSLAAGNPILEPGFATYGVPFDGPDEVRINLVDVVFHGEGEAHFSMYTTAAQIHMTTANGIDADDFYVMGRGDHRHMNWAFTAKGVYQVTFAASMLQVANDENSRTTSDPQTLTFAIGLTEMGLWLLERGVDPGELGEADSPAGDGVPNLLKYALDNNRVELRRAAANPRRGFARHAAGCGLARMAARGRRAAATCGQAPRGRRTRAAFAATAVAECRG